MRHLRSLFLLSCLFTALSGTVLAKAETADTIEYKIRWEGSGTPSFIGAYAIIQADGKATTRSFAVDRLPIQIKVTAPATATVSATGGSLVHDERIEIKIYRGRRVCEETFAQGQGSYATATCAPRAQ